MEPHLYHVDLDWDTQRKGSLSSPELLLHRGTTIEVATPPEFRRACRESGRPNIYLPLR
jgi:hypothetical protein